MPLDLVVIPYHDWRKVSREGARTRDAHFIEQLMVHPEVRKMLILNRPISIPEMIYKRISWKTPGREVWRNGRARAVQIAGNTLVFDYFDSSVMRTIRDGKASFFSAFGETGLRRSIEDCLRALHFDSYSCMSFNLFAAELVASLQADATLFDGWDNFARFPEHSTNRDKLFRAYQTYARVSNCWTTNSVSNHTFYLSEFGIQNCRVIQNGVDPERFQDECEFPSDVRNISRPIVGFGAKVTHLLDCDLLNALTEANPTVNFVMVGQILERDVYRKIVKRPNFHYLGDKPYGVYPSYVRAFDVCIIPYVVGEREHGGDSIKFYEYLAAGKWVVTTAIEGVTDKYGNTLIAGNAVQFSEYIQRALNTPAKSLQLPQDMTWSFKASQLLDLLKSPKAVAV